MVCHHACHALIPREPGNLLSTMASRAGLPELLQLIIEGDTVPDLAAENAIPPVGRCPSISPRPSGKTEAIPEKTHRCKSFRRQFGSQSAVLKSQTLEKLHYETSMTEPSDLGRLAVRLAEQRRMWIGGLVGSDAWPETANRMAPSSARFEFEMRPERRRYIGQSTPSNRPPRQNRSIFACLRHRSSLLIRAR